MWTRILPVILVIAAIMWWRNLYRKRGKEILPATFIALLIIVVGALVLMGKLHWISVVLLFLLSALRHVFILAVRYLPILMRVAPYWWSRYGASRNTSGNTGAGTSAMDIHQARSVLGVAPSADRKQIIEAHRKLIQRLHPDRGGNTYLTRTVNQARDILLEESK